MHHDREENEVGGKLQIALHHHQHAVHRSVIHSPASTLQLQPASSALSSSTHQSERQLAAWPLYHAVSGQQEDTYDGQRASAHNPGRRGRH